MIESNIYEYLSNMHPSVADMLIMCRAEKRFIGYGASHFETFRELCIALPKLSGHPLFFDVCKSIELLFGQKIFPSRYNCEELWRAFWGEKLIIKEQKETVSVKYTNGDVLRRAISISNIKKFIRPNPYTVSLINEKYSLTGCLDEAEQSVLSIQNIRQAAISCHESGETLLIDARGCSLSVVRDVIKYLERSGLLPATSVILDDIHRTSDGALNELLAPYEISAFLCVGNDPDDIRNKIKHAVSILPLGEVTFITDVGEHDLTALINALRDEWIWRSLCSEHVEINVEKIHKQKINT